VKRSRGSTKSSNASLINKGASKMAEKSSFGGGTEAAGGVFILQFRQVSGIGYRLTPKGITSTLQSNLVRDRKKPRIPIG
jgi:hypothetical protein